MKIKEISESLSKTMKTPRPLPLRLSACQYCEADTARSTDTAKPILGTLSAQLTASLRRPGRRTLSLINKALAHLTPFESPKATVTSPHERHELLALVATHRQILSPYADIDRIESNLRHS